MNLSMRSLVVSMGLAGALSLAFAGASSAATPADNTPELNYLRSCVTGLSELQSTVKPGDAFPLSCDDIHLSVAKPSDVSGSAVWRYGGGLLIDVALSDRSHLRFDGKQIVIPPTYSAPARPQPRMRMAVDCGPSRCCTDGGYCCNWATGGSPICGPGR